MINHTQGQVSVSMNTDTVNVKYTSLQPTKELLYHVLEVDLRLIETITPNFQPHYKLTQACGGNKPICPAWIRPTEQFPVTTSKNISVSIISGLINVNKQVNNK